MEHDRKLLTPKQYEFSTVPLYECGPMVGGWLKAAKDDTGFLQP